MSQLKGQVELWLNWQEHILQNMSPVSQRHRNNFQVPRASVSVFLPAANMGAMLDTLGFTPCHLLSLKAVKRTLQLRHVGQSYTNNLHFSHLHSYSGIWKLRCRQTFFYGIVFSVVLRLIPGWMLITFLKVFFFLSILLISRFYEGRDHVHFISPGPGILPSTFIGAQCTWH